MRDREDFQNSIKAYLKAGRSTQTDLAQELHYKRDHLNKILNGHANIPGDFAQRAVRALATLNCIQGKDQARRLLKLMDAPDFPAEDWNTRPLADLDDTIPHDPTVITDVSISQLETVPDSQQSSAFSLWTVPYHRNPFFTGRDELLDQLHQQLIKEEQNETTTTRRAALTQPQAIKGLGGIGKTQIAVEYAYRWCDLYACIFWLNAATEEALISSFAQIAECLPSFAAKNETDQKKLVEAIKRWLEQFEQRWLLIFDNVEDIPGLHKYLPQGGKGSILLTTRASAVGSFAVSVEVETMGFVEGSHLLLRRVQRFEQASDEDINLAGNIVVALDHFPLALDQAGAYIDETKCSLADYLKVYEDHREALLARRGMQSTNYPNSVATTWSLSFRRVVEANPAAADLLRLCAFLAPDQIPEELIREGSTYWTPLLQEATSDFLLFNQMLEELLKFSLVKRLAEDHMLSIHRLVQAVQIDTMKPDEQSQWAERVIRAVNGVFPNRFADMAIWPQYLRYLDQAQVCSVLIEQYNLPLVEAADLLNRTSSYLIGQALYRLAEPLCQQALLICERQLGLEHPDAADSLNNLALLYQGQGKYKEAELLYQRALLVYEQQLGTKHSGVIASLNYLAGLYEAQGRYAQAEKMGRRALAICEQVSGSEHPNTATCLARQASFLVRQRKYEEAELLYQRTLLIRKQKLGPEHPYTADSLHNLAVVYQLQGKYEEAEKLCLRALVIHEQKLGPEHPGTADKLACLASFLVRQGKYEEAELLYQRTLLIHKQTLGPAHPRTVVSLHDLATLYRSQGKYEEAELLYQQALTTCEQQLGFEHPDTADSLIRLAAHFKCQNKYTQAEPLYQRALAIYEQQLGSEHPDTATGFILLASLYERQGKYEEAELLCRRVLLIREQLLGPEHPGTPACLAYLAHLLEILYERQGKHAQTEPLYQRVLVLREAAVRLKTFPDTNGTHELYPSSSLRTIEGEGKARKSGRWQSVLALFWQRVSSGRSSK